MARRKATDLDVQLFDIVYQDGTISSNRKVRSTELSGLDTDREVRALIEAQDRKIEEMSGRSRGAIKSIAPSRGR